MTLYMQAIVDRESEENLALHRINAILSAQEWSVGMLEDIRAILDSVGFKSMDNPPPYEHH